MGSADNARPDLVHAWMPTAMSSRTFREMVCSSILPELAGIVLITLDPTAFVVDAEGDVYRGLPRLRSLGLHRIRRLGTVDNA